MIDVSPELIAFLRTEYDRCRDEEMEDERTTAIDRYNGEPYGDEEDGRSQVVARDTAETVDYMVISILRTIVSGDDVVEFVHRNSELAHQATQTIKHLFMDDQDGYRILHDWLKAGLLEKNAVAMTYPEMRSPKRQTLEGVSPMALMAAQEQGMEIIEAEESGVDENGDPIFTVTASQPQPPKFCDAAVPNEEFYCSPDARTITEAPLKGRRVRKTVSELVAMGYDADELESVASDYADTLLDDARDENRYNWSEDRKGSNRVIWWHEDYVTFDADGDGIAEHLYIQRTGDYKVFAIEPMEDADDHPFEDWCPFPMQHRRVGQSLADKVMDIERIRTVVLRQSLDGIYLANNPRTYVHEDSIGENTIEDLLNVRPGAVVRWRGGNKPETHSDRFDASMGFTMLEFMNGERESRTGITRLNQGLDAEALNKTATGTALMQAQGQQVEEYLARNFANALARLFTKKAKLLKRFGKPLTVPVDGEFIEVDPSQWPEDMIARPRVGLGSGRKEQRLMYRQYVAQMQAEAVAAGMTDLVTPKHLFNSAKGIVNDMGLGDAGEYFADPDKPEIDPNTGQPVQKPEKPDPEMAKAEAMMQAKQAELQMKGEAKQQELAMKAQEGQAKLQMQQQEAGLKAQIEQMRTQTQAALAQQKAQFEAQLAQAKMMFEQELAERQHQIDTVLAMKRADDDREVKMSKNRPGGALDK